MSRDEGFEGGRDTWRYWSRLLYGRAGGTWGRTSAFPRFPPTETYWHVRPLLWRASDVQQEGEECDVLTIFSPSSLTHRGRRLTFV